MKLTVVDLFSGCGGMSSGFARQGKFELIGAADLEVAKPSHGVAATKCNDTYQTNHGLRPLNADLSIATPKQLAKHFGFKRGDLDVLISCAPCTGFSQKKANNHVEDDPRNKLVQRTADFADAWRPTYVVIENVKELLRGKHSHHFQSLHKQLSERGYEVSAEVHDLSDFGLPQSRKRSLIIAKLGGRLAPHLPKAKKKRTVRETIGRQPRLRAGEVDPRDKMHLCPNMSGVSLERTKAIPHDGGSWHSLPAALRIPSMNPERPGSFPDIYGRLWWDRPAPTITRECSHPGNGRYCHPEQDRLLSVREMALLQGFPADYVFEGELSMKYRQIGDAVPPSISRLIAELISRDADGILEAQNEGQMQLAV
jgi:DNA (cytosine-5)-methyltransferase 1